jgi:Ricin-type beta-trefoil lectin domain
MRRHIFWKQSSNYAISGWYAVYANLPLYELKALIDALYFYVQPADPDNPDKGETANPLRYDLAQNYHRLPLFWEPNGPFCLQINKREGTTIFVGYSVQMASCLDVGTQKWVYDRVKGTIKNSGSVVDPATGQCLRVNGASTEVQVIASGCLDSKDPNYKLQEWTYDPESDILLNGTGRILKVHPEDAPISVWAGPPGIEVLDDQWEWRVDDIVPGVPSFSDTMNPGETMYKGESRVSRNNTYELILQTDGNLVLYDKTLTAIMPYWEVPHAVWASGTNGKNVDRVVMGTDGNLAIYPPSVKCRVQPCSPQAPIWQTVTQGHPSSHLKVQDDGLVVIYDKQSKQIWPNWVICSDCNNRP